MIFCNLCVVNYRMLQFNFILEAYINAFLFQDLLALLKNVENEIKLCEVNLKDELEKRRKYQVN